MNEKEGQILIIINTLKKGGAEKQSVILANQLSEHHNVTLLVLDIRNSENSLVNRLSPKVDQWFFDGIGVFNLLSILGSERAKSADIIFSMLARSNTIAALLGLINRNAKVYGGIRNCQLKRGKFTAEYILHRYFHDKTIFNNKSGEENLVIQGFIGQKSVTIHNCINYIPERTERQKKDGKVIVVSLSRFVPQKDLKTAIKTVEYLYTHLQNHSFIYLIGGYGEEKESLMQIIDSQSLSEFVKIKESPDVYPFLNEADIFLSTSLIEGTSNSILEAMSHSLPVVATDVGDNGHLINDSVNGYLVDTGDYKSIALHLKELIENPEKRCDFGRESHNRVKKYFDEERFTRNYLELINE